MKRRPLLAGNWKMHHAIPEAVALARSLKVKLASATDRDIVVCPVFTCLKAVADVVAGTRIEVGGQDCHHASKGAYTGAVSPGHLLDAGCRWVILGHSERRQFFGETDEAIFRKLEAALKHGLRPIVCVGERLEERERGETEAVVERQFQGSVGGLRPDDAAKIAIAYEPVWAIGTGRTAQPNDAQAVHAYIRKRMAETWSAETAARVRILYGGSVKPENIDGLMAMPDIDGALVGGASLEADSFERIVKFRA
jgi:triosephosphate isomerase